MEGMRVAYTLEQCWHRVPGGTAVAALEVARALPTVRPDVTLLGVSGTHHEDPSITFDVSMDVAGLSLRSPWLYEASLRLNRPRVEGVWPECDLVHCTTLIPLATARPMVATVHDVAFMHYPQFFTRHGNRIFRRSIAALRSRAARILCSSTATMNDLRDLGFGEDRLRLVPLGVKSIEVTDEDRRRVRAKYSLPDEYLLFVGTLEPRKNLERLVTALAMDPSLPPLVVAGLDGWGEMGAVHTADVRFIGYVDDWNLPALYADASALCYPSLWEGFGLPILEAMSHGTPVVTSRSTSTEEVAGGAAVLVDPMSPDDIVRGVREALSNADQLSAAGLARAATSSWSETAAATAAVYDEVLG